MKYNQPLKYKEICKEMDDEVYSGHGSSRIHQLKRWQKEYEIEKVKTYYFIKRPLTDEEKYIKLNERIRRKFKKYSQFKVDFEDANKSGVYIIENDQKIYIGQTTDFYRRFYSHMKSKYSNNPYLCDTQSILLNNGTFSIVQICDDKIRRCELEKEWIKYFRDNDKRTVINKSDGITANDEETIKNNKNKIIFKKIMIPKENYDEVTKILTEKGIIWN